MSSKQCIMLCCLLLQQLYLLCEMLLLQLLQVGRQRGCDGAAATGKVRMR
jgi:hypothetical protein